MQSHPRIHSFRLHPHVHRLGYSLHGAVELDLLWSGGYCEVLIPKGLPLSLTVAPLKRAESSSERGDDISSYRVSLWHL